MRDATPSRMAVMAMAAIGGALVAACMAPPPGAGQARPSPSASVDPGGSAPVTSGLGTGCATTGDGVPAGAASEPTTDVDGDGRSDRLWLAGPSLGPRTVGVTTASGATASHPLALTGPTALRAMAVDVDRTAPTEILVSDGRTVDLFVFTDCSVTQVRAPDGAPFVLDLGFRERATGVGCVDADADGTRDLVSLARTAAGPEVVGWSRTIVRLDGEQASVGPTWSGTYREPRDHQEIVDLSTVTCGPRRIEDALSEPLPRGTSAAPVGTG